MRFSIAALVCVAIFFASCSTVVSSLYTPSPLNSVDTRVGAGGLGFQAGGIAPGPQVPFGALRLSPDTSLGGLWLPFQHFGGYSYMDTHIRCFSHTHMVGAGVGDWGNFGVQAFGQSISQGLLTETAFYRSEFSHETETAVPGLYSVTLADPQAQVRLTAAGTMSGMHEYTFLPRTTAAPVPALIFDVCAQVSDGKHPCKLAALNITLPTAQSQTIEIDAYVRMGGGLTQRSPQGGVDIYFHAIIFFPPSANLENYGVWLDKVLYPQQLNSNGTTDSGSLGAYFEFGSEAGNSAVIDVYVGLSFISNDLAAQNLQDQMAAVPSNSTTGLPTFNEILSNTQQIWSDMLGLVEIGVNESKQPVIDLDQVEDDDSKSIFKLTADDDKLAPLNSTTFAFTTFGVNDTNCTLGATGTFEFQSFECVVAPDLINLHFHSLQLYGLNATSNNYSLNLYMESPLCDDFVGWYTVGSLGEKPADCQSTMYFSFQISQVDSKQQKQEQKPVTPSKKQDKSKQHSSKVDDKTASQITQFYSLLYHAFLAPTSYTEANNLYLGFDNQVHTWNYTHADGSPSYYLSDYSFWDIHRTQNPLIGLLLPRIGVDTIRSLYTMYEQGGDIPRWPLANIYTGCMDGNHGLVSVADWLSKDVSVDDLQLDPKALLAAAIAMVDTNRVHGGRTDIANYTTIGYVPQESDSKGAALTLEYSYDDWAVGILASLLGDDVNANRLLARSNNYRNVWQRETGFMCPRKFDGDFECPSAFASLLPYPFETGYVEADAWQEVWFVPHDPSGLISLFNSTDDFVNKLETFIENGFKWLFPHEELPNNYYWSGNEPDIFAPWMFAWAPGAAYRTQNLTRAILEKRYTGTPEVGLPGNDDYGTLSAWATFATLGFYPQAGNTTYILGSPIFPKVTIHRNKQFGGDLTILAPLTSDTNRYVDSVTVNGNPLDSPFILHPQLDGATIVFNMSSTPNPNAFKQK